MTKNIFQTIIISILATLVAGFIIAGGTANVINLPVPSNGQFIVGSTTAEYFLVNIADMFFNTSTKTLLIGTSTITNMLVIPTSTSPNLNATGALAVDTSSYQVVSKGIVLSQYDNKCFSRANAVSTTADHVGKAIYTVYETSTIVGSTCFTYPTSTAGTVNIGLRIDGTTIGTTTCTGTGGTSTWSTNNTLGPRSVMYYDTGTTTNATSGIMFCFYYKINQW